MAELRKPTSCPKCGGEDVRRICYGIPNEEAWALIERGEGVPGGCFFGAWMPDWECQGCLNRWYDPDDPAKQELEAMSASIIERARKRRRGTA